jgi:hypothetical protein
MVTVTLSWAPAERTENENEVRAPAAASAPPAFNNDRRSLRRPANDERSVTEYLLRYECNAICQVWTINGPDEFYCDIVND